MGRLEAGARGHIWWSDATWISGVEGLGVDERQSGHNLRRWNLEAGGERKMCGPRAAEAVDQPWSCVAVSSTCCWSSTRDIHELVTANAEHLGSTDV